MFTLKLKADIKNDATAKALRKVVEDFIDQLRIEDPTMKAQLDTSFNNKKEYR